jgi:hypothetical protein
MIDPHSIFLLTAAFASVVGLVLLIAVFKLNPFISIFLASLALAVATRMPLATVIHSFESGVGATLGHIAIVVALGTILGKMMAESGAADKIAHTLIQIFGPKRIHWAMAVIGLVVGLPVFFEVGFVLLIPIAFTVANRRRRLAAAKENLYRSPLPRKGLASQKSGTCHLSPETAHWSFEAGKEGSDGKKDGTVDGRGGGRPKARRLGEFYRQAAAPSFSGGD